ncbi:MAG: GntR family transcriptional regulator [Boseongicola sp.]|nr:GntR family transcriptional regulator [Boseongicola sp.]
MKQLLNYGEGPKAIYEVLKRQIIAGELRAEQELKILPLAKEMDISIGPLREAIRMLAADRLVELRPRRSPIVARLDVHELVEMNQIRGALEPLILADAVERHTVETLGECESVLVSTRRVRDPMEMVELNKAFHMSLLGPTRLQRSLDIVADQYDGIARLTQYRVIAHGVLPGELFDEHLAIFAKVKDRQTDAAVGLMARHISSATARAQAELAQKDTRDGDREGAGQVETAALA